MSALYVTIPHRGQPLIASSVDYPPDQDNGDSWVEGDHDMHATIPLEDAASWEGHQKLAVRELAREAFAEARKYQRR